MVTDQIFDSPYNYFQMKKMKIILTWICMLQKGALIHAIMN